MIVADDPSECGLVGGERLQQHWDFEYVILSVILSELGAFTSLGITMDLKHVRSKQWYWLFIALLGLTFGYSTVWTMHFVGMMGLSLRTTTPNGFLPVRRVCQIPIKFNVLFTLLSAVIVCCLSAFGLHCVADRQPGERGRLDYGGMRRIGLGSVFVAFGVVFMHYVGMISQDGYFVMQYRFDVILLSGAVALIVAACGLYILMHFPPTPWVRIVSSCVISIAVSGTHYIGMYSATYAVRVEPHGATTIGSTIDMSAILIVITSILLTQLSSTTIATYENVRKDSKSQVLAEAEYAHNVRNSENLIDSAMTPRFPMVLLLLPTFRALGKLRCYEDLRDEKVLVYVDTIKALRGVVLFFSHQWLSDMEPDPFNEHYVAILGAATEYATTRNVKEEDVYIWVDYSSVPQLSLDSQQLAIDSIGFYTAVCTAFVIIAPPARHTSGSQANFDTYKTRLWCRFECLTMLLGACSASNGICDHVPSGLSMMVQIGRTLSAHSAVSHDTLTHVVVDAGNAEGRIPKDVTAAMFVVDAVDGPLRPLEPWDQDPHGTGLRLRDHMRELCFVYEGSVTCCSRNHVVGGAQIRCDKHRLVGVLVGLYGRLLRRINEESYFPNIVHTESAVSKTSTYSLQMIDEDMDNCRPSLSGENMELQKAKALRALAQDGRLFPERFFGSRLRAMEDFVLRGGRSRSLSRASSGPGTFLSWVTGSLKPELCDERDLECIEPDPQ